MGTLLSYVFRRSFRTAVRNSPIKTWRNESGPESTATIKFHSNFTAASSWQPRLVYNGCLTAPSSTSRRPGVPLGRSKRDPNLLRQSGSSNPPVPSRDRLSHWPRRRDVTILSVVPGCRRRWVFARAREFAETRWRWIGRRPGCADKDRRRIFVTGMPPSAVTCATGRALEGETAERTLREVLFLRFLDWRFLAPRAAFCAGILNEM